MQKAGDGIKSKFLASFGMGNLIREAQIECSRGLDANEH